MLKTDFAKFGAYVQQDDILIITMTPEELFTFAATITSNMDKE